jgi:hypothetical protein
LIRFPKMHIAESVVNRILNVADGLPSGASAPTPPPYSPNPALEGARLNEALAQPVGEMPPIQQAPEVATGKPALDTLIGQQ